MNIFKNMTIANKGLRYKLTVAFSLMTIIPMLACAYVVSSYLFPAIDNLTDISIVILASLIVALLGLFLARKLVDPVIEMAIEARIIANGDYDRRITASSDDEIGELGQSINSMTQKIKLNLDELKDYGQKVREINVEIHKKVLALSSLLQIGGIISEGHIQLDSVLEIALEKASLVFDKGFSILFMPKEDGGDLSLRASYNITDEKLEGLKIKRNGQGIMEKVLEDRSILAVDKTDKMPEGLKSFLSEFNLKNILAIPIYSWRRTMGLLVVGNRLDDFKYRADDIDLIKVFAKQITIVIENDILQEKTKKLEIKDDLTDLYNKSYILTRLEEEIKRAIFYQRPCSFIVFNIDDFKKFRDDQGELVAEDALRRIARLIRDNANPIDKAARVGWDEFAILMPEKNKRQAAERAEDLRKKIEAANFSKDGAAKLTVSVGVSENPIDGATSEELFKKAMDAARQANLAGKNRVVV